MNKQDYNAIITVNATAEKAFNNIKSVSKWWGTNFEGSSQKSGDVFTIRFGKTWVTFEIAEVVPDKKIAWLVTDCNLEWIKDKKEWKGTKMLFKISAKDNATQISVTHIGLVPGIECYNDCVKGWNFHLKESLFKLITEGKGMPDTTKDSR
ncbi:MAG: SRPBCC domain-containing protein [Chitinophagales bacterium]